MKLYQTSKKEITFKNSSRLEIQRFSRTSKATSNFVFISGFRMPRDKSAARYLTPSAQKSKRTARPLAAKLFPKQRSAYLTSAAQSRGRPFDGKKPRRRKKRDDLSMTTFIVKKLVLSAGKKPQTAACEADENYSPRKANALNKYRRYNLECKQLQRSTNTIMYGLAAQKGGRFGRDKGSGRRPKTSAVGRRSWKWTSASVDNGFGRVRTSVDRRSVRTNKPPVLCPSPAGAARESAGVERVYFRKSCLCKSVVVVQFDGVIGNFIESHEETSLYLRPNACAAIKLLQRHFQVVLLFRCVKAKAKFALEYLISSGIEPDSAYIVIQNPWSKLPVNYSQIYTDYEVSPKELPSRVIIIGSYDCEGLNLINPPYKYYEVLNSVPIPLIAENSTVLPIVVLFKNALLSKKLAPLNVLSQLLLKLARISKSWNEGYKRLGQGGWTLVETYAIYAQYANDSRAMREVSTRRAEERRKEEVGSGLKETISDAANVKYMQLLICNDGIKDGIKKYKEEVEAKEYSDDVSMSEIDTTRLVNHKLIIIKEDPEKLQSYQYVETMPKAR